VGDITASYLSDQRLKTNIEKIEDALGKLRELDGILFNWNELAHLKDTNAREAGIIAQQVQSVLPEIVSVRSDGYLAVRYEQLIPLMIEAIKDIDRQVQLLKKK
jgi:hypothetical protein